MRFFAWNLAKLALLALLVGALVGLNQSAEAARRADIQRATIQAEQDIWYPTPLPCPTPPPGAVLLFCGTTR